MRALCRQQGWTHAAHVQAGSWPPVFCSTSMAPSCGMHTCGMCSENKGSRRPPPLCHTPLTHPPTPTHASPAPSYLRRCLAIVDHRRQARQLGAVGVVPHHDVGAVVAVPPHVDGACRSRGAKSGARGVLAGALLARPLPAPRAAATAALCAAAHSGRCRWQPRDCQVHWWCEQYMGAAHLSARGARAPPA